MQGSTSRASEGADYSDLIFLCGPLRSGTTLTRLLLQQHSQISTRGESDYYFDESAAALRAGDDSPAARDRFAEDLATQRITRDQNVTPPPVGPLRGMIESLLEQERPAGGGRLLLTLHRHADLAAELFPKARFIRLRRDPRDVAVSAMKMGWSGNPYHGVDVWRISERHWQAAIPKLAEEQVTDLSFESLVNAPEVSLRRVLEELDLPFEEAVLTPSGSTYSAPSGSRAKAWQSTLTEREAAEINAKLGALAENAGYDCSERRRPSPLRKLALRLGNRFGIWRHDVSRYGPRLFAEKLLAHRMGSGSYRRSIGERIQARDRLFLK